MDDLERELEQCLNGPAYSMMRTLPNALAPEFLIVKEA